MEGFFPASIIFLQLLLLVSHHQPTAASDPACRRTCGSTQVNYPFGTGYGCGSPGFYPLVSCSPGGDQLLFTTHTGAYPITSISYPTSTLTITPPKMSTCNSMQSSPNFGLDWPSPFQLGPSVFLLLACPSPTSSLSIKGTPICDAANSHLCASIHTCPAVTSLGLSIYAPANTCCVYSPANLNSKGDLDLQKLECAAYVSVVSLGDVPTDPNKWVYGVNLQHTQTGFENDNIATHCAACESSEGVCGYAPPRNNFVCVCKSGLNSSTDCYSPVPAQYWSSSSIRVVQSAYMYSIPCIPLGFLALTLLL